MPTTQRITLDTVFNMRWELTDERLVTLWKPDGNGHMFSGEVLHAITWALDEHPYDLAINELSILWLPDSLKYRLTIGNAWIEMGYFPLKQLFRDGLAVALPNHICSRDYVDWSADGTVVQISTCPMIQNIRILIFHEGTIEPNEHNVTYRECGSVYTSYNYGTDRLIIIKDTDVSSIVRILVVMGGAIIESRYLSRRVAGMLMERLIRGTR